MNHWLLTRSRLNANFLKKRLMRRRWPLWGIAIVHRLGTLEIGEISIFIALSLAHRKEGFDALRYAIDTFKEDVPIWKKEFFASGEAEWILGS